MEAFLVLLSIIAWLLLGVLVVFIPIAMGRLTSEHWPSLGGCLYPLCQIMIVSLSVSVIFGMISGGSYLLDPLWMILVILSLAEFGSGLKGN